VALQRGRRLVHGVERLGSATQPVGGDRLLLVAEPGPTRGGFKLASPHLLRTSLSVKQIETDHLLPGGSGFASLWCCLPDPTLHQGF